MFKLLNIREMGADKKRKLVIILGPTAVGKTDYSIELALKYGSPVISAIPVRYIRK